MIPARLASTRFARKVLASKTGRPLIWHAHEAAARASLVDEVVVAADSDEVVQAVAAFGGRAVLTRMDHANGASRIAQACDLLGVADEAIVVNVQADEPEIEPAAIDAVVEALGRSDAPMATIASPFAPDEDPADPNIVKVVFDRRWQAMYFSRSLIPFDRDGRASAPPFKHVGLYAYRRSFLRRYCQFEPTPLERSERLEQLRVLEHGCAIAVATFECRHHGIDTPEHYAEFVERWRRAHR